MSSSTEVRGPATERSTRKAAIAALTGTTIEYYEFGVYGYLAVTISPLFFPSNEPTAGLLSTLAVFGSSFLVRPLGGVLLGWLGDRIGRKAVLLLTVIGMGSATALTGLLPTHGSIGLLAPLALLIVRLLQGFFAGGEVTGAAAYVAESAPTGRRGFYGGFTPMGVALGGALAATVAGVVSTVLTAEQMSAWGWRIPFLCSIPLIVVSLVMRKKLEDTHEFETARQRRELVKAPLGEVLTRHFGAVAKVVGLSFGQNAGYWVGLVFMNIYLTKNLGYDQTAVFWIIMVVNLVMGVLMPLWGGLSDRKGRKFVLTTGFIGYMVLVLPMMLLMNNDDIWLALLAMVIAAIPFPIVQSVGYPTYAEQFPTRVRYTGLSLSFNIGTILGGGIMPYAATWLISASGSLLAPGWLLIGACVIALLSLLAVRETSRSELAR
ncbi:MAG: MFS transporter [Saccharopolyspora sp.]|uniref:MFS transporter n=1 Tax=Saccharopolyspora sp. TaxID=33915 RepID=UPI0025F16E23|nr:MFS transporter [Saccharopolyspora sp.]MBQ6644555.1 MFS transporter [Saccharopolyspora sp.]